MAEQAPTLPERAPVRPYCPECGMRSRHWPGCPREAEPVAVGS